MGYAYVASPHNYYEGRLTLTDDVAEPGMFVTADFAKGTASVATAATAVDTLYVIVNENDDPIEYGKDDVEQTVEKGAYLKLAKPQRDMVLKTTKVTGTPAVGAKMTVTDGVLAAGEGNWVVRAVESLGANNLYEIEYLV
jgi:hypothetical protein